MSKHPSAAVGPIMLTRYVHYLHRYRNGDACLRLPLEPSPKEFAAALAEARAEGLAPAWEDASPEVIEGDALVVYLYPIEELEEVEHGIAVCRAAA